MELIYWIAIFAFMLIIGLIFIVSGLKAKLTKLKKVSFRYTPEGIKQPEEVSIAGDFNGWNPSLPEYQMKKHKDTWVLVAKIPSGKYNFKFVQDGYFVRDMQAIQEQFTPKIQDFSNDNFNGRNGVLEIL